MDLGVEEVTATISSNDSDDDFISIIPFHGKHAQWC